VKSLRVELRFKNAVLWQALRDRFGKTARLLLEGRAGLRSPIPVAAQIAGVSAETLRELLRLAKSPYRARTAQATETALKIAEVLDMPVSELFPIELYAQRWPKLCAYHVDAEMFLPLEAARNLTVPPPDELIDTQLCIDKALLRLSPREEKVIRQRFGLDGEEKTLEELGRDLNVTRERVRMIEARGLRHLRKHKALLALR